MLQITDKAQTDSCTIRQISASCAAGAILGAAPRKKIDALARFGRNAGMAFQITDDILDYMAKGEEFGKSIGIEARLGESQEQYDRRILQARH